MIQGLGQFSMKGLQVQIVLAPSKREIQLKSLQVGESGIGLTAAAMNRSPVSPSAKSRLHLHHVPGSLQRDLSLMHLNKDF